MVSKWLFSLRLYFFLKFKENVELLRGHARDGKQEKLVEIPRQGAELPQKEPEKLEQDGDKSTHVSRKFEEQDQNMNKVKDGQIFKNEKDY